MRKINQFPNQHAGKLLLIGLTVAAFYNWRLWQRDKALLAEKGKPEPLPPLESLSNLPFVSVLVAAWNEADNIQRHIESFSRLRYPNKELVLCAGGPDGTYELAARFSGEKVTVFEQQPGEGKQRALSRCLAIACGQVIFLTDADCELDDVCFEKIITPVVTGAELVATGSHRPLDHQLGRPFIAYQWYYHLYCLAKAADYIEGLEGRNTAISRKALQETGDFIAVVPVGTDYHLARQLLMGGYRIRYVPESQMRTEYPSKLIDYWSQQSRWFRNLVLHGLHFRDWTAVSFNLQRGLIGLIMVSFPLACFGLSKLLFSGWAVLFAHAFLSRVRYTRAVESNLSHLGTPQLGYGWLVVYTIADLVAWALGVLDLLIPFRRWKW